MKTGNTENRRMYFALTEYLNRLTLDESQKPYAERRQIPTIAALSQAVRDRHVESKLHKVTVYNIASGNIKMLNFDTARMLIDELWHMGFRPTMNDLFKYDPPE